MSTQEDDLPFERVWSILIKAQKPGLGNRDDWSAGYSKVCDFQSINQFWMAMRCLPAPTNLVRPATYNIFRDNIIPAWEDPGNVGGGRIRVFGQSKQGQPDLKYDQRNMMNQLFVDFLLCIIGGELDNAHVFTGLILDPHKPLLEFWFGKNEEEPETILSTISSKLRILVDQRDFFQPENFKVELKPFS